MNIYDIAKQAGVSIATVSRVLNDSPKVSEKTRRKVQEVMHREEYVPNAFARGLGLNTMRTVGVVCTDVTDPFYAAAVGQVEGLLRAWGMDTLLCCTGSELSRKKQCLVSLVERKVDAVVLIGSAFQEETDNSHIREAASRIPVVIVNGWISLPNVYCVVCDERGALRDLMGELKAQNAVAPLYLYDATTYSGNEKLRGFWEGCQLWGMGEGRAVKIEKSMQAAEEAVRSCYAKEPFDCVVASEDLLAVGALKGLERLGRRLPVVGFNNSVLCRCTTPELSSVDNMLESMCQSAVRILSDLDEGRSVSSKTLLSARLVRRASF